MRQSLFLFLFVCSVMHGQSDSEAEYFKTYEENIKKEFINDVYIPEDFEDAFEELKRLAEAGSLEKFKNASEAIVAKKLHFGLGRWMSLNWNFEGGSRLSHKMKVMGITFPDDMVQCMIISFHRHLNDRPLLLKEQANQYFNTRKKENEDRKKRSIVINPDIE